MISGVIKQTKDHITRAQALWFGLDSTHNQLVKEHAVVGFAVVLILMDHRLSRL
jgi:hypothetical protein